MANSAFVIRLASSSLQGSPHCGEQERSAQAKKQQSDGEMRRRTISAQAPAGTAPTRLPSSCGSPMLGVRPGESPMSEPSSPGYARRLGVLDATMVVVGGIIGSGIFLNPAVVAQRSESPGMIMLAWTLGGVFALAG